MNPCVSCCAPGPVNSRRFSLREKTTPWERCPRGFFQTPQSRSKGGSQNERRAISTKNFAKQSLAVRSANDCQYAYIYGVHIVTVTGLLMRIPSTRIALSTGVPFPGAHWWRRSGITGHNQQTLTVTFPWWRAASATPPFFTATRIGLAIRMQTCINQVILHRHI
jgi:hypothetical protein